MASLCSLSDSVSATPAAVKDVLASEFSNPPGACAPQVWWEWMNGNVTREGITADLESMKRVGIGEATMMTIGAGIPAGPVDYMSDSWREMVRHALKEAQRLGLKLGTQNCAGWSSSGGPWIKPEQAMQKVVTAEQRLKGPVHFSAVLPQPETKLGFYRDIAVVAFPTPLLETVKMIDCGPVVTSGAEHFDGAKIVDGKIDTEAVLPLPTKEKPQSIQIEFAKPYEARTLAMVFGGWPWMTGEGEFQVSDDGHEFRKICGLTIRGGPGTYELPKSISSRYFRIVLTQGYNSGQKTISIAEVNLRATPGIDGLQDKAGYGAGGFTGAPAGEEPEGTAVHPEKVIDLAGHWDGSGKLEWDVPAGDWTVLRVGYTPVGTQNHPPPQSGLGLECDKMSRAAAQAHWDGMMAKLVKDAGPLAGKTLDHVLIDSYEVGWQNWTPAFREEFRKHRGYDLLSHLPVFAGWMVGGRDQTERFLWDIRRTIADLFAENYYDYFAVMAHRAGLQFHCEPYGGGPLESLLSGRSADRVMGEFWAASTSPTMPCGDSSKLAASVAHIYGKSVVGAEAFTSEPGKWQHSPASLKSLGDWALTQGINSFSILCFAHQPWANRWPGMTMAVWGSNTERTNTWWEQSAAWMRYLARCQYLLRQGLFVADALYFQGERAPNFGGPQPLEADLPAGYAYDGCNADVILNRLSVKNGRLTLPDGMSYRTLVLPATDAMSPALLRKIKELAYAGAMIVGRKPIKSPSLAGFPKCDAEVKQLGETLWSSRKIASANTPAQLFAAIGLKPDFESAGKFLYIHRTAGNQEIYFVSNQKKAYQEVDCTFRVSGKIPELWDPNTGKIEKVPLYTEEEGRTRIPLRLDPTGSIFVVFREKATGGDHPVSIARNGTDLSAKDANRLEILHASYEAVEGAGAADVTVTVARMVSHGTLSLQVNDATFARDPAPFHFKQLKVEYAFNGKKDAAIIKQGTSLDLPVVSDELNSAKFPDCQLASGSNGALSLEAWKSGAYEIKMASGKTIRKEVAEVPAPMEITGPWEVTFPPNWGAPDRVTLDKLISWSDHGDFGVKHFSGTATYHKTLQALPQWAGKGRRLYLDLGKVQVIAEVKLNGTNLGILWKPPFCVEVTDKLKPGDNLLEVNVTNLWANRLIGDEQLPNDCVQEREGPHLKAWPKWLLEGKPSPTGRFTFTTWHHWSKEDALLESGLLGPVTLSSAVEVAIPPL